MQEPHELYQLTVDQDELKNEERDAGNLLEGPGAPEGRRGLISSNPLDGYPVKGLQPWGQDTESSIVSAGSKHHQLTYDVRGVDVKLLPPPAPLPVVPDVIPDDVEVFPAWRGNRARLKRPISRDHDGKIVGGSRSAPGRWPMLVAIYRSVRTLLVSQWSMM